MTGLALESSDMDMVVTGLDIPERQMMIEDIQRLAEALEGWNLIEDMKTLESASIPVIKAKINLKTLRAKEMPSRDGEGQVHTSSESDDEVGDQMDEDSKPWILPIDITFDDSPTTERPGLSMHQQSHHNNPFQDPSLDFPMGGFGMGGFMQSLGEMGGPMGGPLGMGAQVDMYGLPQLSKTHSGISSFNLLRDYITRYPCLREVGVLLKKFLVTHDLNSSYLGKYFLSPFRASPDPFLLFY